VFAALLVMRLADRFSLPYAVLFLVGAALLSDAVPALGDVLSVEEVERLTVVALVVILFEGGLHIGLGRFARAAAPILALGVLGTFLTAGVVACAAHYVLGFSWIESGLVGSAIAPTDPAVTFSVFGAHEIRGRTGTILEGEAGMNDPVGIAFMIGMIELAEEDDGSLWIVAREFFVEIAIGLVVGIAGALLLLPVMRRVRLTGVALHPIRVLAGAGIIYGLAAVAGGSGFLAVFVAGVVLGDAAVPRKGEIESFHSSLAGLAEIAAFVALGLTITISDLGPGVWGDGLALALILAFVARPLAVVGILLPARLDWGERLFIAWGGLKGAVPILLGALAVLAAVEGASRLYAIVFVVVLFSVIAQGASVPYAARRLGIPFQRVDEDLAEVIEFVVQEDTLASGNRIGQLPLGERAWVGVLIRNGRPHSIDDDVVLEPGDHVHVYCQPEDVPALERIFSGGVLG
jgi:potassium/hydrogen antiporter